jgi:hypothetical protein
VVNNHDWVVVVAVHRDQHMTHAVVAGVGTQAQDERAHQTE